MLKKMHLRLWLVLAAVAVVSMLPETLLGQGQKGLVPAQFNPRMDNMGFNWDIDPRGLIQDGTSDCFDHGSVLLVNGQDFGGNQRLMDPKTGEFVITQQMGDIEVTRRIWVDTKEAACRYVETFKNTGRREQTVSVSLRSNLGTNCQQVISDQGTPSTGTLGKKEGGLFAIQHQGSRPSVFWLLADARSKVKPTINNQNNYQFVFTYAVELRPGATKSIVHVVGQRRIFTMVDAKSLDKMFKPYRSRKFMSGLPTAIRRSIINWGRGYFGGAGLTKIWTLPEDLGVTPGNSDMLVIGEGTQLKGIANIDELTVSGRFGEKTVALADVAGVTGQRWPGMGMRVYLRDGQVLAGRLSAKAVRFTMNSGLSLPLQFEHLDRIVMQDAPNNGKAAEDVSVYIETFDRDRLAVKSNEKMAMEVVTPWGPRTVRMDELLAMRPLAGEYPGHEVTLKDGSRFIGFMTQGSLKLQTKLFGAQTLSSSDIRAVVSVHFDAEKEQRDELNQPHLVLTGGHVLVGRLDMESITLASGGGAIPVPPQQIRQLHNVSEEVDEGLFGRPMLFYAELWGGGTVTGQLNEMVLPVRTGESVVYVSASDIVDVIVPTPMVPEATRHEIAELIRELGHNDWKRREEASRRLADYGQLAKRSLQEALRQSNDPEVRRRVQALLDGME